MTTAMTNSLLDSMVSISEFNKSGATRIFDEVRKTGVKVVLKNNSPTCVLISPDRYRALIEEVEELKLYAMVAERIAKNDTTTIPAEEVYRKLGIEPDTSDEIPMEYGVDFV